MMSDKVTYLRWLVDLVAPWFRVSMGKKGVLQTDQSPLPSADLAPWVFSTGPLLDISWWAAVVLVCPACIEIIYWIIESAENCRTYISAEFHHTMHQPFILPQAFGENCWVQRLIELLISYGSTASWSARCVSLGQGTWRFHLWPVIPDLLHASSKAAEEGGIERRIFLCLEMFFFFLFLLPSGKPTKKYGKPPFLMDKSTILTGPFSSSQTVNVITRGYTPHKNDRNLGILPTFSDTPRFVCDGTWWGLGLHHESQVDMWSNTLHKIKRPCGVTKKILKFV